MNEAHLRSAPSPSEELQRLALILTSDSDARADMIYCLILHRSSDKAGDLADAIARIMASEENR